MMVRSADFCSKNPLVLAQLLGSVINAESPTTCMRRTSWVMILFSTIDSYEV